MIVSGTPKIAEIEQEIIEVDEDLENVNGDIRGDNLGIGVGAVLAVPSCSPPSVGTVVGAGFCAA